MFNMIISDYKLLSQLWMENDELIEYDELNLSNQDVLQKLTTITQIKISFNRKDDLNSIKNTISQLCILIDKCPNLEFVKVFSSCIYSKKNICK